MDCGVRVELELWVVQYSFQLSRLPLH
uniref:Uncharacterized protein n=1 Tax=Arundo donax TaxID=35708 RepID=A0A0A9TQW6_ARUDO